MVFSWETRAGRLRVELFLVSGCWLTVRNKVLRHCLDTDSVEYRFCLDPIGVALVRVVAEWRTP